MDAARVSPGGGRVDHELIWAPLLMLGFLAAHFLPLDRLPLGACPLRTLTGIPCPTCGGTRAAAALARPDLRAALAMNPLVALAGMGGAAYVMHALGVWLLGWRRWRPSVSSPARARNIRIAVVVAILLNWTYLIVVGR